MDDTPDPKLLAKDIHVASLRMQERMQRFGINPKFKINLTANEAEYEIYPGIEGAGTISCQMDERLLRRILDRNAHWNNAEIGAHISFYREPNTYDPDLHTGLQFFHL
jgi:hypothetical protein